METTTKKTTIATLKSFIKKNAGKIYVKVLSDYNGQSEMVEIVEGDEFKLATSELPYIEHTLGVDGLYIDGGRGRDRVRPFENDQFMGLLVSNCCGRSIVAVQKPGK